MADEITYIDRESGQRITEKTPGGGFMRFLYNHPFGKLTLHLLFKRKLITALGGWYLNTSFSKRHISPFIEKYAVEMNEYITPEGGFRHFNDFFYRRVKPERRPAGKEIVSPADGKVIAFSSVGANTRFFVKGYEFRLDEFLRNEPLARRFEEGPMLIVRLAPVDYHRFHFPADGHAGPSQLIKGSYFSVSPIALKNSMEIFCLNKRAWTLLESPDYGGILICEVGATMVGSIVQTYQSGTPVVKGQEKGYFAFGGSTVVLLFEKGRVEIDQDLIENTQNGIETQVKMGAGIAQSAFPPTSSAG